MADWAESFSVTWAPDAVFLTLQLGDQALFMEFTPGEALRCRDMLDRAARKALVREAAGA